MEKDDTPAIKLSYSSARTPRARLSFKWLSRLPHWLIGLALWAPPLAFSLCHIERAFPWKPGDIEETYMFLNVAALFIAGSIRRLNWRHLLVMLCLAVLWFVLHAGLMSGPSAPFPYNLALFVAAPVLIVALGEWGLVRPRPWGSALWAIALAAAVGCLVPLIQQPLDFTGVTIPVRSIGGWTQQWPLGRILYWPLLAVLTWNAVPMARKLGGKACRRQKLATAGIVVASVSCFLLFFCVAIYPIARRSLAGNGVFSRAWSVTILKTRCGPSDQQAMWEALEAADWSRGQDQDETRYDYRLACIGALAEKDRHATALRLSKLLFEKPSSVSAESCAPILAQDRRYEAAPMLMRYALLQHSPCTEALEAMRVPNVALAILRAAAIYDRPQSPSASDFPISQDRRRRLTVLLRSDAGANLHGWMRFYDQTIDQQPTPLSRQDVLQTNRVIDAVELAWQASDRLYQAQCRLFVRRLKEQDNGSFTQAIATLENLQDVRGYLTLADIKCAFNSTLMYAAELSRQKAFEDMAVATPNWDARGTADLEREVRDYASRVDAMIARYDGPDASTQPATAPASPP